MAASVYWEQKYVYLLFYIFIVQDDAKNSSLQIPAPPRKKVFVAS